MFGGWSNLISFAACIAFVDGQSGFGVLPITRRDPWCVSTGFATRGRDVGVVS